MLPAPRAKSFDRRFAFLFIDNAIAVGVETFNRDFASAQIRGRVGVGAEIAGAHGFDCGFSFLVVQAAVAILVEFLEHGFTIKVRPFEGGGIGGMLTPYFSELSVERGSFFFVDLTVVIGVETPKQILPRGNVGRDLGAG